MQSGLNKISVLLSVYNDEANISESINSILNQTYQNFELLIADDGSTDNTQKIVESFLKNDKRIKFFKNNNNQGLTKTLNFLSKQATSNFLARQDSDDYSLESRLEKQLQFLYSKNLDATTSKSIDKSNSKVIHKLSNRLPSRAVIKIKNPFVHGSLLIKRDVFEILGGYNENFYYSQDYKLFTDLINKRYKIKIQDEILYLLNTKNNISTLFEKEQKYYADCVRRNILPIKK